MNFEDILGILVVLAILFFMMKSGKKKRRRGGGSGQHNDREDYDSYDTDSGSDD